MRVKPRDLKQGKTFWEVSIYVNIRGVIKTDAEPKKIIILAPPYINEFTKAEFVRAVVHYDWGVHETVRSLHDMNVIQNSYNLNSLFTTRKSAEQYAKRIIARCFTPTEAAVYEHLVRTTIKNSNIPFAFDNVVDCDCDDGCAED